MSEDFGADLENLGYTVKREGVLLRVCLPRSCGVTVGMREGRLWLDPFVGLGKISRGLASPLLFFSWLIMGGFAAWSIWQTPNLRMVGAAILFGIGLVIALVDHVTAYIATEGAMGTIRQLYLTKYQARDNRLDLRARQAVRLEGGGEGDGGAVVVD
jgi:hypothetical protein